MKNQFPPQQREDLRSRTRPTPIGYKETAATNQEVHCPCHFMEMDTLTPSGKRKKKMADE